jgi:hypothetical protein
MENPLTFYTATNKENQLLLLNEAIVYSTSRDILLDLLAGNKDVFISEITFKELENSAKEMKIDIYKVDTLGGTFEFQKLIIFGSDTVH